MLTICGKHHRSTYYTIFNIKDRIIIKVWIYTIVSVVIVSFASLVGIVFLHRGTPLKDTLDSEKVKRILLFLVSFSVGGLFGDAFIHLLPESFEVLGSKLPTSIYVILGVLFFFSLEKFVRWRHCHVLDGEVDCSVNYVGTMILVGDGIHNFIDGMLIGVSYTVSIPIGISTTLAVFFHEIPQEIGDFGVLLHSGYSAKKALLFNFLSALTAILGAIISLIVGPHIEGYAHLLLPFTAGGFIYIAGSDLIPELHREVKLSTSIWQLVSIIAGIVIMALLTLLE